MFPFSIKYSANASGATGVYILGEQASSGISYQ